MFDSGIRRDSPDTPVVAIWAQIDGVPVMTLSDRIEQARNRRNLEAYAAEVSEVERRKRLDTIAAGG